MLNHHLRMLTLGGGGELTLSLEQDLLSHVWLEVHDKQRYPELKRQ